MRKITVLLFSLVLLASSGFVFADDDDKRKGLNKKAKQELVAAGVTQYVGQFAPLPATDAGDGWLRHTYVPNPFGAGPMCIAGTPYSVFTKAKNPKKVMIFLQGGGACWEGFYNCNIDRLAESQRAADGDDELTDT